ncbi:response regulator transcription factor [Desulfovibrio inopinatus]|uniref:response regulator transcription factor n=1 Tax=Desulfovibrio inopinatus TaxID=102109 RepID=UPI0004155802|nr:response regulator [Desulfovibrio inopinatus]
MSTVSACDFVGKKGRVRFWPSSMGGAEDGASHLQQWIKAMSHRILLLDNDLLVLDNLASQLDEDGYTVFEAHNTEMALAFMELEKVDLVVVDLGQAGMNGVDFIHKVRAMWPAVRFFVYSDRPAANFSRNITTLPGVRTTTVPKNMSSFENMSVEIRQLLDEA